jgi:hypothetical protein
MGRSHGPVRAGQPLGIAREEALVPDRVLLEEFHLTMTAPAGSTDAAREAMRRVLNRPSVRAALRRAARAVLARYPALRPVRLTLAP